MSKFYENKAFEILNEIQYLTIASVTAGGEPWNTPVFSAFDSELNFYWTSSPKSQHSQNIANNKNIFIIIYKSVVDQGTGWGVYMKAHAAPLKDTEIDDALLLLGKRRKRLYLDRASFGKGSIRTVYKASPHLMWVNDAKKDVNGEYVEDYRAEIDINILKDRIAARSAS